MTCRSSLLTFGNVQNLVIQSENELCIHTSNTLEILVKFIVNTSQYCSTYSEVPPSSDALYFNVYEALISTIEVSVYVAT
jgi:S-adenosylmethionine hydrolase